MKTKYQKHCPVCKQIQTYSNKYNLRYAQRDNKKCRSCIRGSQKTVRCTKFNLASSTAYYTKNCRCSTCVEWYKQYYSSETAIQNRKQYYITRKKDPKFVEQERKRNASLKDYRKNKSLQQKYGITLDDYNKMLKMQKGTCCICKKFPHNKSLAVDHDHKTGKVRGLLCCKCNLRLHEDFIKWSHLAINYINSHSIKVPAAQEWRS